MESGTMSHSGGGSEGNVSSPSFADPWGLERKADDIQGLGCPLGAEVANLRHIKLTRQAATLWQSYDSFARVSLSIGINQLILAISYYFMAYLVVDVGCHAAGAFAIVVLIVLADCCLKLEISLKDWQLPVAQMFGVLGPICGLIAAHEEAYGTDLSRFVAYWCIPFAFLAHGLYLTFMIYLCKVVVQPNGARVPAAFKQKLYLDAFGWIKAPDEDATCPPDRSPHKSQQEGPAVPPAMDSLKYGGRGTCPTLPQDLAPNAHSDMRLEDGACDPMSRLQIDTNIEVPFYHWRPDGLHRDQEIVTGHEAEGPGVFPWRIFHLGLTLLASTWIGASIWGFQKAMLHEKLVSTDSATKATKSASLLAVPGANLKMPDAKLPDLFKLWASGYIGSILSDKSLELIPTTWSQAHISPRTLSCDASGKHILVTDGLLAFGADLRQNNIARFEEMHCSALVGEGLQDAAVVCKEVDGPCEARVLHRNGRRVAACPMISVKKDAEEQSKFHVATVSETWLERDNETAEKLSSIAVRPFCDGESQTCTYARTTHGRMVQLRQRTHGQELVPAEILQEVDEVHGSGTQTSQRTVRTFSGRYLGVLQPERQSIDILDSSEGGLSVGKLLLPPALHVSAWCAGGGHIFMLSAGPKPALWRMALPRPLSLEPA